MGLSRWLPFASARTERALSLSHKAFQLSEEHRRLLPHTSHEHRDNRDNTILSLPDGSNMDLYDVGSSFPSAILHSTSHSFKTEQTSQAQGHHTRLEPGLLERLWSVHFYL